MVKAVITPTTSQSLGSLLKSARDIMSKDKGLNGDLNRLPMLTRIMFLGFPDDLELGAGRNCWKNTPNMAMLNSCYPMSLKSRRFRAMGRLAIL